jgi:hypothetical protein
MLGVNADAMLTRPTKAAAAAAKRGAQRVKRWEPMPYVFGSCARVTYGFG